MNKEVTVTGMELKTKVGANLLACDTNKESDYKDDLVQNVKALLEPVSTINASDTSFFYTVNAAADGHWLEESGSIKSYSETKEISDTNAAKTKYDDTFNTTYGNAANAGKTNEFATAYGYVDYVFFIKATGEKANQPINMTECNLIYDDKKLGDGDYAWRVAIFADDITSTHPGDNNKGDSITGNSEKLVSILDIKEKSKNWSEENADETAPKAISKIDGSKEAVSKANTDVKIGEVGAGATVYYKVVARVWLEGEDKSCNSTTYAKLQDKIWELGLQFELDGTAVSVIESATDNDTGAIMATTAVAGG